MRGDEKSKEGNGIRSFRLVEWGGIVDGGAEGRSGSGRLVSEESDLLLLRNLLGGRTLLGSALLGSLLLRRRLLLGRLFQRLYFVLLETRTGHQQMRVGKIGWEVID